MPEHCQPPLPLMYLGAHATPLSPQKRMRKADYKSEANAQKLQKDQRESSNLSTKSTFVLIPLTLRQPTLIL